jgi:hypothetical protein
VEAKQKPRSNLRIQSNAAPAVLAQAEVVKKLRNLAFSPAHAPESSSHETAE